MRYLLCTITRQMMADNPQAVLRYLDRSLPPAYAKALAEPVDEWMKISEAGEVCHLTQGPADDDDFSWLLLVAMSDLATVHHLTVEQAFTATESNAEFENITNATDEDDDEDDEEREADCDPDDDAPKTRLKKKGRR